MRTGGGMTSFGDSVRDFPGVGERMQEAYIMLMAAETLSDPEHVVTLAPAEDLPRPWDPSTCHQRELRREVWDWLDRVVAWINTECAWDVGDLIPGCWYRHPHLVHEIGVVADQRRRAGLAFTSDQLEEWQRSCLPLFVERTRAASSRTARRRTRTRRGGPVSPATPAPRLPRRDTPGSTPTSESTPYPTCLSPPAK